MEFAADKYCVTFGGIKLFVEQYSFARASAAGETMLLNKSVSLHNGGAKAARLTLSGKSETPCAHKLDNLIAGGEAVSFEYGGMKFEGAVLVSYSCKGKSGSSEEVTAEFVCEGRITETAVTA